LKYEPSRLEILLTRLAFYFYGKSVYRSFADRLPLKGGERVLDFGCGMGTVAYYVAKRLPLGHLICLDISSRWLNACRKTLRGFENIVFIQGEATMLAAGSLDTVYSHFVLHDISESELEKVIPALARALKVGGVFVFREPLNEAEKINIIKRLMNQNNFILRDSRVTDIPVMGNALESIYIKK
jgi:ubiquinone/menaquinone biosynthesis C-methylase UbiE